MQYYYQLYSSVIFFNLNKLVLQICTTAPAQDAPSTSPIDVPAPSRAPTRARVPQRDEGPSGVNKDGTSQASDDEPMSDAGYDSDDVACSEVDS